MPSKTSLCNKEILLQIGRSTGWISIVYFLGLLLFLPCRIIMLYYSDDFLKYQDKGNLFLYNFDFQVGMLVLVPVILSVFLFRFLHVKQATDLIHSLPLKRGKIYHHYALSGMLFLIIPIVVITILLLIMHAAMDLTGMFSVTDIYYWAGTTLVITLLLYTAGVFIAMMTGLSVVQAVLAYIFLLFPAGITLLVVYNLQILIYGYPGDYFLNRQLERLSPISYTAVLNNRVFQWQEAVIYLALTIALYGLALLFYRKRKLEAASEAITFPKLKQLFKYGVTFCTMLFGGVYFYASSFEKLSWAIAGYAAGAVVGYFIAEMVLAKSWRVFRQVKGLVVYVVIVVICLVGIKSAGLYENKVPEEASIHSVLLSDNPNIYMNSDEFYQKYYTPLAMKEKTNIEAVRKLQEQIIKDKAINRPREQDQSRVFFFRYELKNGNYVTREYRVNERLYEELFKPIYESKEYKVATNELFKVKEDKVKSISIGAFGPVSKMITLSNPQEINEVIAALREDVMAESYKDGSYFEGSGSTIEVKLSEFNSISLNLKPGYQTLRNWLTDKKLLDRSTVTADDISHVLIAKGEETWEYDSEQVKTDIEKNGSAVDITDKGQISQLLQKNSGNLNYEYQAIVFYNIGNYYDVVSFDEEHVPDFVTQLGL